VGSGLGYLFLKKFVKFVFIENIDKVEKVYLSADLKKCPRGDFAPMHANS